MVQNWFVLMTTVLMEMGKEINPFFLWNEDCNHFINFNVLKLLVKQIELKRQVRWLCFCLYVLHILFGTNVTFMAYRSALVNGILFMWCSFFIIHNKWTNLWLNIFHFYKHLIRIALLGLYSYSIWAVSYTMSSLPPFSHKR